MSDDLKYKGMVRADSGKALLIMLEDLPHKPEVWIPRSLIDYLHRSGEDIDFTLPAWKARELGLEH